ncbi:MAG: hypothetical protein V4481_01745, partial [Patescibacteria group bacterium]
MNKKLIWSIVAIIVIVVAIILVQNNAKPQTANEPIKIGAVISLTGFAAPWGEYAKNGINLAAKEINDSKDDSDIPVA